MLKKRCALFLAVLMVAMTLMSYTVAFATEVDTETVPPIDTTENANGQTNNTENNDSDKNETGEYDTGVPDVTLDEFEEKVEGKFYKLIKLMQTGGKPFCIIIFIIGALVSIVGALGKGGAWKGLIVMGLAALAYTAIMYAPEIVQFIQQWTVS
jgi:hypothetical protein